MSADFHTMKPSKVKKAIRQGNRFGMSQPVQDSNGCCAQTLGVPHKPRRSIPVAEVHKMIDHEVSRVKASQTIYDDRLAIIANLQDNESFLESLEARLHEAKLANKSIRSDLARVNLAITRQLELDGE